MMRDSETQKNLGIYYTPPNLAQILADWAILDRSARVLDPSFGGCAFLDAAVTAMEGLGAQRPVSQIFGIDVDLDAHTFTKKFVELGASPNQFIEADFFEINPEAFGGDLFDAVIGNPPYVRYHKLLDDSQQLAINRLSSFGIAISKRASYWAYFLLYSVRFLREGGRLAMILPGSFIHTDYSKNIRDHLAATFRTISVFFLEERVFNGTDEESLIVLCDGALLPHSSTRVGTVKSVSELAIAVENLENATRPVHAANFDGGWLRPLIKPRTSSLYDRLVDSPHTVRAEEWLRAGIGVVTGANDFFILSSKEKAATRIPDRFFLPIIRRPHQMSGLEVSDEDLSTLEDSDEKHLLLALSRTGSMLKSIERYIEYGEKAGVNRRTKCKNRNPWYVVPRTHKPAAFMQIMSAGWPRLVVNRSSYTCTNNIMRLDWKVERPDTDWLRLSLGSLSTLTQLSAELVGRSYGGGVLKLEPSDARKLVIPLLGDEVCLQIKRDVDTLLQQNELLEATNLVDRVLIESELGLTERGLRQLRVARNSLFLRRRQHRADAHDLLNGRG